MRNEVIEIGGFTTHPVGKRLSNFQVNPKGSPWDSHEEKI